MPITSTKSDATKLTLTVVGEYNVPVQRLWEAWNDPRQLEKFWGPPTWPATFTRHDARVGGHSKYHMTGPDGTQAHGWWRFLAVEPARKIEIEEGFAHSDGRPNDQMPSMRMTFTFEKTSTGSRFTALTKFPSIAAMEQLATMGMVEGMESALNQMDRVMADLSSFAASRGTDAQILSDTQVRISRVIRGSVEQVWRAHHEAKLMQRWMLGPDGWTMPVCDVAKKVGDSYRFEWAAVDGSQQFGFEGTLLESEAPHRAVTTEKPIGMDVPPAQNEMTLTTVDGGTLLTLVITYPSAEIRDMALGSGMTVGMERGYVRLEEEVLAAA
jgi:uncharacterized protein YndB with AHSA1/START domain